MIKRTAQARWEGKLKNGQGFIKLGSGAFEGQYSFNSRFEKGAGTNPEELIAAAHAGCFSMAFSLLLEQAGFAPTEIQTTADLQMERTDSGFKISKITLNTQASVPNIDPETFQQQAQTAKANCPVSVALAGVSIELNALLK